MDIGMYGNVLALKYNGFLVLATNKILVQEFTGVITDVRGRRYFW
jgi:hypothetical protein